MADGVTRGMQHVAIVGGGYAGMAAATELASRSIPVTVFEAGRVLGGRARRVESDGRQLDNGLHILLGAYEESLRLIELVRGPGDAPGLIRRPLELTMHPDFRMRAPRLPAPLHLLFALLGARGLAFSDRIAAARFMDWAKRQRFRIEHDTTVSVLLESRRQPAAVSRYLWHPLCVSALNTPPTEASAQIFLNVLRDGLNAQREHSDLLLPAVDFSELFPERASRYVEARGGSVKTGAAVESIRRHADGFRIGGDEATYSQVVLAVSPHRAAALLGDFAELSDVASLIDAFQYQPIYSVYLQYTPGTRLPFAMGGLEARYTQWLFDRGQLCGQDGQIGVVISASGAHQDLPRDELARKVHEELAGCFPQLGDPEWHQVIAEKRATFSCTPGLKRPANTTPVPGFFLAGDYTASDYPATIEAAVRSGVRAARLVMEHA